jgi:hypothetical protein
VIFWFQAFAFRWVNLYRYAAAALQEEMDEGLPELRNSTGDGDGKPPGEGAGIDPASNASDVSDSAVTLDDASNATVASFFAGNADGARIRWPQPDVGAGMNAQYSIPREGEAQERLQIEEKLQVSEEKLQVSTDADSDWGKREEEIPKLAAENNRPAAAADRRSGRDRRRGGKDKDKGGGGTRGKGGSGGGGSRGRLLLSSAAAAVDDEARDDDTTTRAAAAAHASSRTATPLYRPTAGLYKLNPVYP